jgi:formate/nitrite transporter FocA (FNT family)
MQELAITWQRVARVWWLITWRSFVGAMVLAMIFGFVVGVVRYVAQVDIPSSPPYARGRMI